MYILYADESGDSGLVRSPTSHFALASIVIHEARWRDFISQLMGFRKTMRSVYGLPLRTEIHAYEFLRRPPTLGMPRHIRLAILRNFIDELAKLPYISITSVVVQKKNKPANFDVFSYAWQLLFQRFENTLLFGNFPGEHKTDYGLVITDNTDGTKLQKLVRRMAVFNYVPYVMGGGGSRNLPNRRIIEDPNARDSRYSYIIQACDTAAYFLMQKFSPNSYIRRMNAQNYYDRLAPVLNLKASKTHPLGIVVQ